MTPAKAPNGSEVQEDLQQKYPTLVGKLLWVSNTVWPDICYAVNTLAQHMSTPTKEAMQMALCVVKYLNQMQNEVLWIGSQHLTKSPIKTYTDANWASDPNTDHKSTSGLVIKVYGSIVMWNSHVQKCTTSSTIEAEYIAGSTATREVLFHGYLLCSLGFSDQTPMILTDNTGCIQVVKDQAMHTKLKHINTRYHLICDHIQEGDILMKYVKTNNNLADFLTKPVSQHLLTQTH
ncbi:hypothetical protein NDA10_006522 [Ustilago hordei]|nr:hypothetical protein NDA10_006522 [Ustilago hordei]